MYSFIKQLLKRLHVWLTLIYNTQTKLRKGKVFRGVCLSTVGGPSLGGCHLL